MPLNCQSVNDALFLLRRIKCGYSRMSRDGAHLSDFLISSRSLACGHMARGRSVCHPPTPHTTTPVREAPLTRCRPDDAGRSEPSPGESSIIEGRGPIGTNMSVPHGLTERASPRRVDCLNRRQHLKTNSRVNRTTAGDGDTKLFKAVSSNIP